MDLTAYHQKFSASVRWRVTPQGIQLEGQEPWRVSPAASTRVKQLVARFGAQYAAASMEFGVPIELLIACSCTEAAATNPEYSVRQEPGYVSDEQTPHRISAGLCQLLISTARAAMKDATIDRKWLYDPLNCLRACAAYMRLQSKITGFDPIYTACAYNAGGLYQENGAANHWKLRQYPIGTAKHADRFAEYTNAALQLVRDGALGARPYRSLVEWLPAAPLAA